MNEGYYEQLHQKHGGQVSLSTEEIEKDLNRWDEFVNPLFGVARNLNVSGLQEFT